MNTPLISIVLPIFNGAKYMRQSIDSCLNQTHQNIELIIVDDGSTDETPNIVRSYTDPRIKYVRHEKNKGLPNALNTGFALATGEFPTWTSHDNYYAENSIEKMLTYLKKNNSQFVNTNFYRIIVENASSRTEVFEFPEFAKIEEINTVGPCFLYTKEVMETVGDYDIETFLAEDYDYWIRISKKFKMHHLEEPLYYYRIHEGSLFSRFTRQHDIKIVALLVRVKNNIINIEKATDIILSYLVAKESDSLTTQRRKLYRLLRLISLRTFDPQEHYRKKHFNNINSIIKSYKTGKINFEDAKIQLKNLF